MPAGDAAGTAAAGGAAGAGAEPNEKDGLAAAAPDANPNCRRSESQFDAGAVSASKYTLLCEKGSQRERKRESEGEGRRERESLRDSRRFRMAEEGG